VSTRGAYVTTPATKSPPPATNPDTSTATERPYDVRGGIPCQCTTYHYDGNRNVIEMVDSDDTDSSDGNNSTIGGIGDMTRYEYDGFDRRIGTIDAIGNEVQISYDPNSNMIQQRSYGPLGGSSPTSNWGAGIFLPTSDLRINGSIFVDRDEDDLLSDLFESGIADIGVALYEDDGDGVFEPDDEDMKVADTESNYRGDYSFINLTSGDYWVQVDDHDPDLNGRTYGGGDADPSQTNPRLVAVVDVVQVANFSFDRVLLSETAYLHDELNRTFQTDYSLFVSNGVNTVRTPEIVDGQLTLGDQKVTTRTEYDRKSRVVASVEDDEDPTTRANEGTTFIAYDGADRQIKTTDAAGNTVEYAYDDNNNLIETRETDVAQIFGYCL
jgi:YD repeat-containing protein